jgi:hypothetical protein
MQLGKQLDIDILANAVLDFLDQLHTVQLTISMTKYPLMGYNPREHVCELFDFEV